MKNKDYEAEFMDTKPKDWPMNAREHRLELIWNKIKEFEVDPTYKKRERLLALVCDNDANRHTSYGKLRVTEFEAQLMNLIFFKAERMQIKSIKVYLYNLIAETTRVKKIMAYMDSIMEDESNNGVRIEAYEEVLLAPLQLYHLAYQKFTVEKTHNFPTQLLEFVENSWNENCKYENVRILADAFSALLTDLSYMRGNKKEKLWEFSREDLYKLIKLEARLFEACKIDISERPAKGIIKMQLSNYILKSRNGYNKDYICKYISSDVAALSVKNHEIWMRKVENLNDEREQKVIPELFEDYSWIPYSWAKDFNFEPKRVYFVSSFCKERENEEMRSNYGECVYGYMNDRIFDLIGPIGMRYYEKKNSKEKVAIPFISQVIAFDVIYDKEEAKEELKYLFSLIELFDLSEEKKHSFLEELLQYWILSVKDYEDWHKERERRYVIFMYDDYEYVETIIEDDYLKMSTTLFLFPDFILGNNPAKKIIQSHVENKQTFFMEGSYFHCKNCLMQDYDIAGYKPPTVCPICGSDQVEVI